MHWVDEPHFFVNMSLLACVNVGFIPSQYIAIAILRVIIGVGDITLIDAIDVAFVFKNCRSRLRIFPFQSHPQWNRYKIQQ